MNARERLLLIAAIILLGGVCFKFVIYDHQQAAHASLVEARDAAAAELARNQRILARADKVHAEYDRLTTFIATVEAKLPTSKEIPSLLTAMEQFTHRLGIGLESFQPGSLQPVTSTGAPANPSSGAAGQAGTAGGGASSGEAPGKAVPYSRMQVSLTLTGTFAQVVDRGGEYCTLSPDASKAERQPDHRNLHTQPNPGCVLRDPGWRPGQARGTLVWGAGRWIACGGTGGDWAVSARRDTGGSTAAAGRSRRTGKWRSVIGDESSRTDRPVSGRVGGYRCRRARRCGLADLPDDGGCPAGGALHAVALRLARPGAGHVSEAGGPRAKPQR